MAHPPGKERLLWLPFVRPVDSEAIASLENALAYAIESDSWVESWYNVKRLNRQLPTLPASTRLDSPEMKDVLSELAQAYKARWVVTGAYQLTTLPMTPEGMPIATFGVNFWIYDAQADHYALNLSWSTEAFIPGSHFMERCQLTDETFRQLVARTRYWLGALGAHPMPDTSPGWQPSYQTTLLLSRLEDWPNREQQLASLKKAALQPNPPALVYWHLARVQKNQRDYTAALNALQQALIAAGTQDFSPVGLASWWVESGICHALAQQPEAAIGAWQRAIELSPTQVAPYINIAHTLEELEELDQAQTYLIKAQHLAPSDSRLYYNLARIYSRQELWDKALIQYQLQLILEPEDPWCYSNIAVCYLHLHQENKSRRYLERTIALDPEGEAGQYAQLILMGFGNDLIGAMAG